MCCEDFQFPKTYNFKVYFWRWFLWALLLVKDTDFFKAVWLFSINTSFLQFSKQGHLFSFFLVVINFWRCTCATKWVQNMFWITTNTYGLIILDWHDLQLVYRHQLLIILMHKMCCEHSQFPKTIISIYISDGDFSEHYSGSKIPISSK